MNKNRNILEKKEFVSNKFWSIRNIFIRQKR